MPQTWVYFVVQRQLNTYTVVLRFYRPDIHFSENFSRAKYSRADLTRSALWKGSWDDLRHSRS